MADLEDALSPTWANVVGGQAALIDAVRGTLTFESPEGKAYRLAERTRDARGPAARLAPHRVARARRWRRRSRPSCSIPGCTCSTTAPRRSRAGPARTSTWPSSNRITRRGSGTRCSSTRQTRLGIPRGSIRATVLIETILAAFEMDEILYELREHAAGLNAGRWDYLFSVIKKFRTGPTGGRRTAPQLTMTVPFMRAYTELLVQTCHRRGAHAIGGMAAFIPNRRDPEVTERRAGQGPRRQGARVGRRVRRHVGRPSRPRAGRDRGLRSACSATGRNRRTGCARTSSVGAAALLDLRCPAERVTEAGSARTSGSRWRTSTRGCAARRGRHRQPDGGRRDRRDRALAAVALADPRRRARRGRRSAGRVRGRSATRSWPGSAGRARGGWRRPSTCSTGWSSTTTSPTS